MQLKRRVLAGFMATIMMLSVLLASPQFLMAAASRTANWVGVGAHQFDVSYSLYSSSWSGFRVSSHIYRLDASAPDLFLGLVPLTPDNGATYMYAYATSPNLIDWTIIARSTSSWLGNVVYEGGAFLHGSDFGSLVRVGVNGDVQIVSDLFGRNIPELKFYNGTGTYVLTYWRFEDGQGDWITMTSQDGNTWYEAGEVPYSQGEPCDETNSAILSPSAGFSTTTDDDGQPVVDAVTWNWDGNTSTETRERVNFYINGERLGQAAPATQEPDAPPAEAPPVEAQPQPTQPVAPPVIYTPAPPVTPPPVEAPPAQPVTPPPVAVYTPAPTQPTPQATMYVTASFLNQRRAPGNEYAIVGVLSRGDAVTITGQHGGWRQVTSRHGEGWVFIRYLSDARPAVQTPSEFFAYPAEVSVAHALNLRTGPGNDYRVTAWLRNGDWAVVVGYRGLWAQVETASGNGWVLSRYLVAFDGKW